MTQPTNDIFLQAAIVQACKGLADGIIPVVAVLVIDWSQSSAVWYNHCSIWSMIPGSGLTSFMIHDRFDARRRTSQLNREKFNFGCDSHSVSAG